MTTTLTEYLGRWVDFCEHRPRSVLLVLGLLSLIIGVFAAAHFAVDSDLGKLIKPSGQPAWYEANEVFKAEFPELQQTAVVVVSGADFEPVDQTARRLAAAFREAGGFEFVFAPALDDFLRDRRLYFLDSDELVAWISGVQYDYGALLRLADGADLTNAAFMLADQVDATGGLRLPSALASVAETFRRPPPLELQLEAYPHLVPDEAVNHVLILLKGQLELDQQLPSAELVRRIRSVVDASRIEPGVRVRLTGEVPLADEEIGAALDGIGIAGTISLLLLVVILRIGVRSWRVIGAIFSLLGVGVVWTLGFAILAVGSFNTLALMFVIMFFGLGVDFAVHFSLRMREATGFGEDPEVHAVRDIGPALVLCMLTSSIAFLSFVPTDYRGLGELGIISAGGMAIALFLTITLIPAFFAVAGMPPLNAAVGSGSAARPVPGSRAKPGMVLTITALIALGSLWLAKDVRFDFSVLAMRDATTEGMSTLLELQEHDITTDYSINLLASDAGAARALKVALEALPEVGEVLIPEDLVPQAQPSKRVRLDPLADLIGTIDSVQPGDAGLAGEMLTEAIDYLREVRGDVRLLDLALFDAFVAGLEELADQPAIFARLNGELVSELERELGELRAQLAAGPFDLDQLPADLRKRLVTADGRHLVTVQPASPVVSRAATERFLDAVGAVAPEMAGRAVVEWGVGGVVVAAFIEAVTIAVIAIGVLLVIHFRGLLLPVMVLVPLALTTLFTFALMALFDLPLNMANILVVPLIFGLGVDTGVHVVHRFQTDGEVDAVFASSTARAVTISALTTIGTFFSLSFSPHKGAASVGLLLTIAIGVMLLVTFVVLPASLRLIRRPRRRNSEAAAHGTTD